MPVWDRAYRSRAWEYRQSDVLDTAYPLATELVSKPILGGLHHEYQLERVAA